MQLQDLALVIPNFLTKDECKLFIDYYETRKIKSFSERSVYAEDGEYRNSNFRVVQLQNNDELYQLATKKQEQALQLWVNYLEKYKCFHVHRLKSLLKFPHQVRILKYSNNQFIHAHSDWDHYTHASVTLNLNSGYTGGKFIFFNGMHEIVLNEGDALVFPADLFWVHEVSPVTSGERYSVNSFIKSIPFNLAMQQMHHVVENMKDVSPIFTIT